MTDPAVVRRRSSGHRAAQERGRGDECDERDHRGNGRLRGAQSHICGPCGSGIESDGKGHAEDVRDCGTSGWRCGWDRFGHDFSKRPIRRRFGAAVRLGVAETMKSRVCEPRVRPHRGHEPGQGRERRERGQSIRFVSGEIQRKRQPYDRTNGHDAQAGKANGHRDKEHVNQRREESVHGPSFLVQKVPKTDYANAFGFTRGLGIGRIRGMNVKDAKHIHLVGIGGINMSAVAKLLIGKATVSGSDVAPNEQTEILGEMGVSISIGHAASAVPSDCDLLVYSSAVPPMNVERAEAHRRSIREMTNFEFLGEYFADHKTIVVSGTHGKSTTTAMLGRILEKAGFDPTVIVGSKVPGFEHGNLRIGASDLFVVEGDEYAKHFLAFKPFGLVINNIELDHTDVFPTIEDMKDAYRELCGLVREDGFVVANMEDAQVRDVVGSRNVLAVSPVRFELSVPGRFNQMNASAAATAAKELGATEEAVKEALTSFKGIWRRFEFLGEKNGAKYFSDYGHHPTAVAVTLQAAKDGSRVLLCFQPHHRNRTKHLFLDFVPSFDAADVLVLCEIYDVAGRDASEDEDVSSKDLVDAVIRHDADRNAVRTVEYAPDPTSAVRRIMELAKPGDVVIVMGAGDIDAAIRNIL